MLFNSYEFLIFFPIVTILYFLIPHRFRWFVLLVASCIFYMFFIPVYILILFFTIIIDYAAGIMIERSNNNKKHFLILSIIANVGVLAFFKYFNFLAVNVNSVADENIIPVLNIILPIGLSFHTFQAMSYTIEVYRGNQKAEKHLGIYALYVMFYPQLVAGPIERPQNILPQFKIKHSFNIDLLYSGLRLMLWGLYKKVVVADRLSIYVDAIYNSPLEYSNFLNVLIAFFFFSIQIYCDFSGYSDIAIGAARVLGIDLMVNFNRPYESKNIREFWSRWHISLSTWFRDYV
ncbi:MAG: MBOAT family O-acyltransferase, partial [Ferruginibacter sp.]